MNVDQAASAVAYLTAMVSGYNDDTTEVLVFEFARLDDVGALNEAVAKVVRSWDRQGRVPLGVIIDAYEHEVRESDQRARDEVESKAIRCDGSGWLCGDFETPCPRCNPAMVRVWDSADLRRRWSKGVPVHKLLRFETRSDLESELGRLPCTGIDVEYESVRPRDGIAIAVAAYRDAPRLPTRMQHART